MTTATKTGSSAGAKPADVKQPSEMTAYGVMRLKAEHLRLVMLCLSDGSTKNRSNAMASTVKIIDLVTELESRIVTLGRDAERSNSHIHSVISQMIDENSRMTTSINDEVLHLKALAGEMDGELANRLRAATERISGLTSTVSVQADGDDDVVNVHSPAGIALLRRIDQ